MKKTLMFPAITLFLVLVGIGIVAANIPAPPVNQNLGREDILEPNVPTATCIGCHPAAPDIHHFMVGAGNTNLGCADCHPTQGPIGNQQMYIEKTCNNCHNGTAFWANPFVNLSAIRPKLGRPHHNQTKISSSSGIDATYWAADRKCFKCHGSTFVDFYNDGHYVPSYNTSLVTPMADYKINATTGNGRKWGGCSACHDQDDPTFPLIEDAHDLHHTEVLRATIGAQCNYCHVSQGTRAEPVPDWSPNQSASPLRIFLNASYPSYASMFKWDTDIRHVEVRNNTILTYGNNGLGDAVNGTGCEKCHGVERLHNIQFNASDTIANKKPGFGHIGNNSDCNGCHAGWVGAADNPFPGPKTIQLDSVTPGVLAAGVATDVTLTGSNFVEDPYTTTVLVDGVSTAPKSITDTAIVVTVNLAVGGHSVQVEKGGVTSALTSVMALAPGTITSAKLANGVLTIEGAGLGAGQQAVAITKADGRIVLSDSITSSTDTKIVAAASQAAVGDIVTVITPTGAATATIAAGTPVPGITSAKLVGSTLTIDGLGFATKPKKAQTYVTTVKSGRTYAASSVASWNDVKIVASVNTRNWKLGQPVTVKTVSGQTYSATIT